MSKLIQISPSEARELQTLEKKQILRVSSAQTSPVLHCEAIVLEDRDDGAKIVSTSPCPVGMGTTYLAAREGLPNLFEVSWTEEAILQVIGEGRNFGYKADLIFGDMTLIPVPETI